MFRKIYFPSKYLSYFILAFVLAVVVYIRIRLLDVPLERDEGEYAYMGQLLLKGIPAFTHAYTMKLPGVSIVYAFFMFLFGQTPAGIHAGLLTVNLVCIFLVYQLTRQLLDQDTALVSSASYAVLSLSESVLGIFAHATHFVVLFSLGGFILLLRGLERGKPALLFYSGICFGLAFTMKQHAVLFLIFACIYFLWRVLKDATFGKTFCMAGSILLLLGAVIPYAIILLWMAESGNFDNFWFWTVQYASEYSSTPSLETGWHHFTNSFGNIAKLQLPFWLLAGFGGVSLCIKRRCCADRFFLFGFILFSLFSISPGLIFREHYFAMLLPAAAIMTGEGVSSIKLIVKSSKLAKFTNLTQCLLLAAAITYSFYSEKDVFFRYSPLEVSRTVYEANPFPEALQISSFIKNNTRHDDKIAILGSEPEIYFYSDRLSATGYIYMYEMMQNQPYAERMQTQLIQEIEAARPAYVIYVNVPTSWALGDFSLKSVLYWSERYLNNSYDLVGVIDIIDRNTTRYLWGNDALKYNPVSESFVDVFKRKNGI